MKLWRSTLVAGMIAAGVCSNASAITLDGTFAGQWIEAVSDNVSRGINLQAFEAAPELQVFFATGFTYAPDGTQVWFAGNDAEVVPGETTIEFDAVLFTGGSPFGAPAVTATTSTLGTVSFEVSTCNLATATFTSNDESVVPSFTTDFDRGAAVGLSPVGPDECAYQDAFDGTCPIGTPITTIDAFPRACAIGGTFTEDFTLTNEITWILSSTVNVGQPGATDNDVTLTIEPGTRVVAAGGADAQVVNITRGSKINAVGQPFAPIVFSSANPTSSGGAIVASQGEFGGLVINGFAPVNNCPPLPGGCTSEGLAGTLYGGADPFDSSGILKYVRVQFGGDDITPDNQLNGIAFQGVGSGTTVDYIQVHSNDDDGIEWFGGTVNVRHAVVTAVTDDSFDWVNGWTGTLQYGVVNQMGVGDQGIEADNFDEDLTATPRSQPSLANLTLIGSPETDVGMLFREGTGVNLTNSIVFGFGESCLDIDDDPTFTQSVDGNGTPNNTLTFQNLYLDCATVFDEDGADPFDISDFVEAFDPANTTFNSAGFNGTPFPPSGAGFLSNRDIDPNLFPNVDLVDFAGAFSSAETAWTAGWTIFLEQ